MKDLRESVGLPYSEQSVYWRALREDLRDFLKGKFVLILSHLQISANSPFPVRPFNAGQLHNSMSDSPPRLHILPLPILIPSS